MSIIKSGILLDYTEVTSGNGGANSSNDSVFARRGQLEASSQIILVGRGFTGCGKKQNNVILSVAFARRIPLRFLF